MRRIFLILPVVSLFLITGVSSACGGFFCTNTPIDQSAERIIFTINDDDTISAIVGINYEGAAEEFSWVVPVPSPPELDVAPVNALNVLQNATNPRINVPRNFCRGVVWNSGGLGGGGGDFLEQGNVGPYDYAIIGSDNPSELIQWLRDNGYRVTDDMQPIIAEYVFEGMFFLAMKLSNDADVGDIQPVKMTYTSDKPMIPLRLTAVAALDDMPVLVWIFADEPYSPDNYVHAEVDFAGFRTDSQLNDPWGFTSATGDYFAERNRIQEEYDGRAFITEYAMPSLNLIENSEGVVQEPYLTDLINQYPFVTRLRAQLSPEQMTVDPVFVPDTQQNHVPQTIELAEYVDPLHYWGCSNRQFDIAQYDDLLPNVTLLPGNVSFRYPDGWIRSHTTFNDVSVEVYAPQTVTSEHLEAFSEGKSDFPILVRFFLDEEINPYNIPFGLLFNMEGDYKLPEPLFEFGFGFNQLFTSTEEHEMIFKLLTTDEDWEQNRGFYRTMSNYLRTYAFYAHPNLRQTLALSTSAGMIDITPDGFPPLLMGFPEGWTEFLQADNSIVIVPDDGSSPRVEIQRTEVDLHLPYPQEEFVIQDFIDNFGLTEETLNNMRAYAERNCGDFPVVEYERDGRIGYFRIIQGWLATVSSVPQEFEANQDTMRWIADSIVTGRDCGLS